jgi:threonine/homoserine/homoserine lactone efflux protein
MVAVIGDILPLAVGVAISPMPIIAVILMLLAPRAGAVSAGFLVGWAAGIVIAMTVVTVIAGAIGLSTTGHGSIAAGIIKIALGAFLLLLAGRKWRKRPQDGAAPPTPKWLGAIDSMTPVGALGLGVLLAVINPKNLVLVLGAGVAVGAAHLPVGEDVAAIAVFTVLASSTVAAPVAVYVSARSTARTWLTGLKTWLVANNATVLTVLIVVIGAVLIGKGIGGL